MLDRRSALASIKPYNSPLLQITEVRGFSLLQVVGAPKSISAISGKLPTKVGIAVASDGRTLMRTGPNQVWIVGPEADDIEVKLRASAIVTPLSHSRTRIVMEGTASRDVLAKSAPLDFHPAVFKPGMFAMTGIHHTPVLIHRTGEHRFEIYALRTFAVSVCEWLTDAALEFAS